MEDWEIREDARILAQAEKIKKDSSRLASAIAMGETIAKEALFTIGPPYRSCYWTLDYIKR